MEFQIIMANITRREIFFSFILALVSATFAGCLYLALPPSLSTIFVLFFLTFVIILTAFIILRSCNKFITDRIKNNYQQTEAFISLNAVIEPVIPLPQMRGSAICPDLANILTSIILSQRPEVIVEFGSGVSTVICSYCIQKNSIGHIWSLDHEDTYATITQNNLIAHGLAQYSTVLYAPLKEYLINGRKRMFYDIEPLKDIEMVHFLFIDGPPRTINPGIRFSALPLLADKLSPNAIVLLDDAARPAERKFVKSWREQFPDLQYEWLNTEKGAVIFKKQG